jgi:hypothetical protein
MWLSDILHEVRTWRACLLAWEDDPLGRHLALLSLGTLGCLHVGLCLT